MSLGLAVARDNAIFLAIESQGLPLPCGSLHSKLVHVQAHPRLMAVVTGGLKHWCDVFKVYQRKDNIDLGRTEIERLLLDFTKLPNQACCLLCGFKDGRATCWRINKLQHQPLQTHNAPLSEVQPIGMYADEAKRLAESLLDKGVDPEAALRKAIESILPGRAQVRGPVHSRSFHAA